MNRNAKLGKARRSGSLERRERQRLRNDSSSTAQTWALILAGGEGSRLRQLTTVEGGTAVPKQFCSLIDGRTLLEDAIDRAHGIASPERTCAIVSQHHHHWWSSLLRNEPAANVPPANVPPANVIVQPRGRGTGIGVLYAALHIAARDPFARVVVLPADHHVRAESTLRRSMADALAMLEAGESSPILLGVAPDRIDTELGYVIPGTGSDGSARTVAHFLEKPDRDSARESIARGALWSTSIIVTPIRSLVRLYMQHYPVVMLEMQAIVNAALKEMTPGAGWISIVEMYERLPNIDLSKDILQQQPQALRVLAVPECGWSDLGTPSRLGETLRLLQIEQPISVHPAPFVDLSIQHALYERDRAAHRPN